MINWKYRIVHEPLYGSFYLPEIAWNIIDTKEFQRLRKIKQTGNTNLVYPGAEHTRFQHSLGVAHLCDQLGRKLQYEYPDWVSEKDRLILCIAGLCHDLGHSAFSHLYDAKIIPFFHPDKTFHHEHASYYLLERIFNRTPDKFISSGLHLDDIKLIGQIILGSPDKADIIPALQDHPADPAMAHKSFMFDIVSNERTGIDLDKFDYLARDARHIGIATMFDSKRLMEFAVLSRDPDTNHIYLKYESRAAEEIIRVMWQTRNDLHRRVYQHRVVKIVDDMVTEVIKASGDMILYNEQGQAVPLSDAHLDMSVYIQLDDNLLDHIWHNGDLSVRPLIDRINSRSIWETLVTVKSDIPIQTNADKYGFQTIESHIEDQSVYHIVQRDKENSDEPGMLKELHLENIDIRQSRS
jgi:HD superfamily phosphohydrolase